MTMSIRTGSVATILLLASGMACAAAPAGAQSGAMGSSWADAGKMPDFFTGMWHTPSAMVEAKADLNVPYTAKAQQYVDTYKYKRDIPYAEDGCNSPGLPIAMRSGPIQFLYRPGLIAIYMQGVGHTRFIRMNQPMGRTSPKYYGNSVGHFEGDTLVIETADFLPEISFQYGVGKGMPDDGTAGPLGRGGGAPPGGGAPAGGGRGGGAPGGAPGGGFGPPGRGPSDNTIAEITTSIPKAIWGPHSEGMHSVERIRLSDPDTIELKLTLYDDTVWTKPYVAQTRHYRHIVKGKSDSGPFSGEPEEWVCTVSITSYDPATNNYKDKDPEEMVKFLDKLGR
jgi:hypothetical protein